MKTSTTVDAKLAHGLTGLLADTYTLSNTTQNCHWNVEGPQFKSLHDLFEFQYNELATAIDMIAERVRVLGFYTPGTLAEIAAETRVTQHAGPTDAETMIEQLIEAHRVVIHRIQEIQPLAEKQVDEATFDMLVERQRVHEKAVWFLRSQAGQKSKTLETTKLQTPALA